MPLTVTSRFEALESSIHGNAGRTQVAIVRTLIEEAARSGEDPQLLSQIDEEMLRLERLVPAAFV